MREQRPLGPLIKVLRHVGVNMRHELCGRQARVRFESVPDLLLPIQPMDGGQILREVLGPRYLRLTCWIGCIVGLGMALLAFKIGFFILAILLGFLAYANFSNRHAEGGVVTG